MATATRAESDTRVDAMRRFNRFYTRQIGVLGEGLLDSPFSLTQVRVLYEVAQQQEQQTGPTATDVARELGVDTGYLSRIIRDFEKRGLLKRTSSAADGRQSHLKLTRSGRDSIAALQALAREEARKMLTPLSEQDQRRLIGAMDTIERLLGAPASSGKNAAKVPYILRPHHPGDIGWIVHRHGVLYAQEYHWDETFEALVATIAGEFVQKFDPKRERCWIAEKDGEIVGSVFVVKSPEEPGTAKLRLLLVEPSARGLGIGGRLVDECVRFARRVGYTKMTLWTQSNLHAARHLYERAGFRLVKSWPNQAFGHGLVSEIWDLDLTPAPADRAPGTA